MSIMVFIHGIKSHNCVQAPVSAPAVTTLQTAAPVSAPTITTLQPAAPSLAPVASAVLTATVCMGFACVCMRFSSDSIISVFSFQIFHRLKDAQAASHRSSSFKSMLQAFSCGCRSAEYHYKMYQDKD